ncbi:hypothetical protein [Sinorhizobium meliloti]|uniref:hypothetical protein n=1 Tax=Rhizobium meliloti TaxID=382 RepID=UPI001F3E9985|nr:hypothetical protein [Sinorhizobium meliloti]
MPAGPPLSWRPQQSAGPASLRPGGTAATRADPVQLRLELLKDQPRARKVMETVVQIVEWNRQRDGRGLGLAYSDAFGTH